MCAGWEKGRVKECALEMQLGGPVITYRITYDDGEEVTSPAHKPHRKALMNLCASGTHAHRWQRTCVCSEHGSSVT